MDYNYKLKVFEEEDIIEFTNLSKHHYDLSNPVTNENTIRWKHINSPYGKSLQHSMKLKKKYCGRIMFSKNIAYIDQKKIAIINPCDLLIDKNHRNNPLYFIKLVSEPKSFLSKKLVIHSSNEVTKDLYEKLLKFNKPFNLDLHFYPLDIFKIILKLLKINTKKSFNFFSKFLHNIYFSFIRKLSSQFCLKITYGVPNNNEIKQLKRDLIALKIPFFDRSPNFIEWRTSRYKKENLVKFKIYNKNKFRGYVILLNVQYEKFKIKLIFDIMLATKLSILEKQYIKFSIIKSGLDEKCDFIALLKNNKAIISSSFNSFSFIKVPPNFLKHESAFFVRHYDYNFNDYRNFHMTFADLDYF